MHHLDIEKCSTSFTENLGYMLVDGVSYSQVGCCALYILTFSRHCSSTRRIFLMNS